MAEMSTVSNYSISPDYVLLNGNLNVYLPVKESTRELIQQVWDLKKPDLEYFKRGHLVAVEWYFEAGDLVLKKLKKKALWQLLFPE